MFTKEAMIRGLATARETEIVGVEAEHINTGKMSFCIYYGEDSFDRAYHNFPLSEWKLTFHGKKWARQTYIKSLADKYYALEREASEAKERVAKLLSRWTGKEKKVCLKEVLDCNVSYVDIKEDCYADIKED